MPVLGESTIGRYSSANPSDLSAYETGAEFQPTASDQEVASFLDYVILSQRRHA